MGLSNKPLQKPGSDPAGACSSCSFRRVPYHIKVLMNISLFVPYFSTADSSFLQNCMEASVYHLKYAAFYQKGSPLHLQKAEKGSISHRIVLILLKISLSSDILALLIVPYHRIVCRHCYVVGTHKIYCLLPEGVTPAPAVGRKGF